jgi:hypothetical protein
MKTWHLVLLAGFFYLAGRARGRGLAYGMPDSAFDPEDLAMGIEVEREHGGAGLARQIAKDHLAEDPVYYQKLHEAGL